MSQRIIARSPFRFAVCFAVAVLAAGGLVACGDDEGDTQAQRLTFTFTGNGEAAELSGPESADSGLAEITLKNSSNRNGDAQLVRVEGNHTLAEVTDGLNAATQGEAFPDWFFAGGGIGTTAPGKSKAVTQVLQPGTYYAFNSEGGPPDAASAPALSVGGDDSDESVEADETIGAFEYGFEAEPLPSGKVEIAFDNTGSEPHHLLASRLVGDNKAADVERFFKTEKGKLPLEEKGSQSTAVIEGGESQLVTIALKPGRYALYCFISDRQGGPPHALKGMVDEIEVG